MGESSSKPAHRGTYDAQPAWQPVEPQQAWHPPDETSGRSFEGGGGAADFGPPDPYYDAFRHRQRRTATYPEGQDPRSYNERFRDAAVELASQLSITPADKHLEAIGRLREKALEQGNLKFSIFSRTSHAPLLCLRITKEGAKAAGVCMSLRPHAKPEALGQIEKFKSALHQQVAIAGGGVEVDVVHGLSRLLLQFRGEPLEKLFNLHGAPKSLAGAAQKIAKYRLSHFTSLIVDYHRNALEVGFAMPGDIRGRRGEYIKQLLMEFRLLVPDNQLLALLRGASYATMTFGFEASAGPDRVCFFRGGARAADIHAPNSDPALRSLLRDPPPELAAGTRWRAGYSFGRGDLYVRLDCDFDAADAAAAAPGVSAAVLVAGLAGRPPERAGERAGLMEQLAARLGAPAVSPDSLLDRLAAVFRPGPAPSPPRLPAPPEPDRAGWPPEPPARFSPERPGPGAGDGGYAGWDYGNSSPPQPQPQRRGGPPQPGFREQYAREQARGRQQGADPAAYAEPYAGINAHAAQAPAPAPSAPPPGAIKWEGRRPQDSDVYQVWRNEEKAPSTPPERHAQHKKKGRW